jgi:glycerol-3-phosphate dehydrogenase subunit B
MSGNHFDLLVIGEGLAGISAAAAANSQGLRVMLVGTGPGTFVLGTACLDVEGLCGTELAPSDYRAENMEQALTFFIDLCNSAGCAYKGGMTERRLVPTVMGTFQTVSVAPRSLWKGDPRAAAKVVVAGIAALSTFEADFLAERLSFHSQQMGRNTAYRSVTIRLPEDHPHALTTVEIADRFDRNPSYRDALLDALRRVVGDAELLILPGILGVGSNDEDLSQFEEDIGCAICELPTVPPSVPGLRLLQRMQDHLVNNGVDVCAGFSVNRLCIEDELCTGILLDVPGRQRRVQADSVILAAGRFSHLLESQALQSTAPRANQVDQQLRPVNSTGEVIARNLFQCGSDPGKAEPRHGNAIAILTGYQAGMIASRTGVSHAAR